MRSNLQFLKINFPAISKRFKPKQKESLSTSKALFIDNQCFTKYFLQFFFFTLICLFNINAFGQKENKDLIILKNEKDLLLVGKRTYFLEDKSGKLSIEDILKPENQSKFQQYDKDFFVKSASSGAFWLKLTIQNQTQKEAWLELGSTFLWYIDYYVENEGKFELKTQTGSLRPAQNKAHSVNLFWLPLSIKPETQTVYIRIKTQMIVEAPIQVGTTSALYQNKTYYDYIVAGFVGLVMIMFLYSLFLFFATKDKLYIWYLAHVFLTPNIVLYANNYPIFESLFGHLISNWLFEHPLVWQNLGYLFVGYFALSFLNLSKQAPIFARWIKFLLFFLAFVFPIINLFDLVPYYQLAYLNRLFILSFTLILLIIGIYEWLIKGDKKARFYTLGWVWFLASIWIYILTIQGTLPYHFFGRSALFFGFSLEVLMFSLALADRINQLRREKKQAQQESLLQLLENQKLIEVQNQVLEQKVNERTQELQVQKQFIETQNQELLATTEELRQNIEYLQAVQSELVTQNLFIERQSAFQQAILDNAASMIISVDKDGIITSFNPIAGQLLGYKAEELLGKYTPIVFHDLQEIKEYATVLSTELGEKINLGFEVFAAKSNKGLKNSKEWSYIRKDGSRFPVELNINAIRDKSNQIIGYLGIANDITERKQIQEKIFQERSLLRTIIDNLPLNIYVKNTLSQKILANKFEWEYLGVTNEQEILGKNDYELYPEESAQNSVKEDALIFAGQSIIGLETLNTRNDGSLTWFLTSKLPLRNSENQIIGLVGLSIDITERKKVETELQRTQEMLEQTNQIARVGGWDLDLVNQIAHWTSVIKEIHEVEPDYEPSIEKGLSFIKEGESREKVIRAFKKLMQDGVPYDIEVQLITAKGKELWVRLISNAEIKAGKVIRVFGATQDITPHKQAEAEIKAKNEKLKIKTQKLNEANRTKDKLFAIIGHDLRSPINSLIQILDLSSTGHISNKQFKQILTHLHPQVKNIHHTLDNLLQWSFSQMQGIKSQPTMIHLIEIIEEKVALLEEIAKRKQLMIQSFIAPNTQVFADKDHLKLILRNLINNAIKFTPEGGTIKITAQKTDTMVEISVADTGLGMSAEKITKLFKYHKSMSTSGTNGEKGTGLGLLLCQEMIEKNKGKIWVKSTLSEGSTFTFSLPIK